MQLLGHCRPEYLSGDWIRKTTGFGACKISRKRSTVVWFASFVLLRYPFDEPYPCRKSNAQGKCSFPRTQWSHTTSTTTPRLGPLGSSRGGNGGVGAGRMRLVSATKDWSTVLAKRVDVWLAVAGRGACRKWGFGSGSLARSRWGVAEKSVGELAGRVVGKGWRVFRPRNPTMIASTQTRQFETVSRLHFIIVQVNASVLFL